MQEQIKFQNVIASVIVALDEMRNNPRKNVDEHMKNVLMIEALLPQIRRYLIYLKNTPVKIEL